MTDWAGDLNDSVSITGYSLLLGGAVFSWRSRKQKCVASSCTHAEYIALYECPCEIMWLKDFLKEIGLVNLVE